MRRRRAIHGRAQRQDDLLRRPRAGDQGSYEFEVQAIGSWWIIRPAACTASAVTAGAIRQVVKAKCAAEHVPRG
jgi:hypothetical protein